MLPPLSPFLYHPLRLGRHEIEQGIAANVPEAMRLEQRFDFLPWPAAEEWKLVADRRVLSAHAGTFWRPCRATDVELPVEVKAPGWEDEIAKAEGQESPRLKEPKYIQAEARATAPWASVRHAVTKAYPEFLETLPNLLVINDDLMVPLLDWSPGVTDSALYMPRSSGHTSGYLAAAGPFADDRYARLGAVGIFNVSLPSSGIRYRFPMFLRLALR